MLIKEISKQKQKYEYTNNNAEKAAEYTIGENLSIGDQGGLFRTIIVPIYSAATPFELSNMFDIGSTENAASKNGDHRGFEAIANEIVNKVDSTVMQKDVYLDTFGVALDEVSPTKTVYWITGHGSGGAIANIVGRKLNDRGEKTFTYTFATPNTTTNTNKNSLTYNSIFNIINSDDVVTKYPSMHLKDNMNNNFNRYGKNIVIDGFDKYREVWNKKVADNSLMDFVEEGLTRSIPEQLVDSFFNKTGFYTSNRNEVDSIASKLKHLSVSRSDLYDFNYSYAIKSKDAFSDTVLVKEIPRYARGNFKKDSDIFIHNAMFSLQTFATLLSNLRNNDIVYKDILANGKFLEPKALQRITNIIYQLSNKTSDKLDTTYQLKDYITYPHMPDGYVIIAEDEDLYATSQTHESYDEFADDALTNAEVSNEKIYFTADTLVDVNINSVSNIVKFEDTRHNTVFTLLNLVNNSYDNKKSTGKNGFIKSLARIKMYKLNFDGESLKVTGNQMLYVENVGYVSAKLLKENDKVLLKDNTYLTINSIEITDQNEKLYNVIFPKGKNHSFFLSSKGVLVTSFTGPDEETHKKLSEEVKTDEKLRLFHNIYAEAKIIFEGGAVATPASAVVYDKRNFKVISRDINFFTEKNDGDPKLGYPEEFVKTITNKDIQALKDRSDFLNDNFKVVPPKNNNDNKTRSEYIKEDDPYSGTKGAGTHAEVKAVAKALKLIEETDIKKDNLGVFVIGKGYKPFTTCPHCSFILGNYGNFPSENEEVFEGGYATYKNNYPYYQYDVVSNHLVKDNSDLEKCMTRYIKRQQEIKALHK